MDENKKYNITLADGTSLMATPDGAGNYLVDGEIEEDVFSMDNLSEVTVKDGTTVIDTFSNQIPRTFYLIGNGKTFVRFSDMTELERLEADYNSKLDYIACMTGVDLDE